MRIAEDTRMGMKCFRNALVLVVAAFIATGYAVVMMFLPMIQTVQDMTSGSKSPPIGHMSAPVLVGAVAALVSMVVIVLAIKGLKLEQTRRWRWALLLIIAIIALMNSVGVLIAAPRIHEVFVDLQH
jgi:hypothetical protein